MIWMDVIMFIQDVIDGWIKEKRNLHQWQSFCICCIECRWIEMDRLVDLWMDDSIDSSLGLEHQSARLNQTIGVCAIECRRCHT